MICISWNWNLISLNSYNIQNWLPLQSKKQKIIIWAKVLFSFSHWVCDWLEINHISIDIARWLETSSVSPLTLLLSRYCCLTKLLPLFTLFRWCQPQLYLRVTLFCALQLFIHCDPNLLVASPLLFGSNDYTS